MVRKPPIKSRFSDWFRNQVELAKFAWTVLMFVIGFLGYSVVQKDNVNPPSPPKLVEICPNKDCPWCFPQIEKEEPFEINKTYSESGKEIKKS